MDAVALPPPSADWALFLDVDGTLLDIAETPHAVDVPEGMVPLLERLHAALGGALALVSGRRIETLDRLFHPLRPPAAGLHGVERRAADGTVSRSPLPPDALDPLRSRLARVVEEIEGLLLEDKGQSLAVHYRRVPARERDARLLVADAARELGSEFELLEGKKVLEIRPRGTGKDKVVDAFMAEPPFLGRTPVFIGDDRTDEDGFAAVNRLGGHSIRVDGEGESAARYTVADAPAVRRWLASIAAEVESLSSGRSPSAEEEPELG